MPIKESHPAINPPKTNISLWRYMDIPSFLSLLIEGSLSFVRSDLFQDRFEGILPKQTAAIIDNRVKVQSTSKYSELLNQQKNEVYLNCWCNEIHEVVHMWKIYSKENGVAIETDYEKLKTSILSSDTIYPTLIQYINFANDAVDWRENALTVYSLKRQEYKSENEFRLVLPWPQTIERQLYKIEDQKARDVETTRLYKDTPVIKCKVNAPTLIKRIHLSPYAPSWYLPLIADLANKYALNVDSISQSDL